MIQHRIIQYHIIAKPRADFILSLMKDFFLRQNNSSFGKTVSRSDLLHKIHMLEYELIGKPFGIF